MRGEEREREDKRDGEREKVKTDFGENKEREMREKS